MFGDRFATRAAKYPAALMISPKLLHMPVLIQRYDDPFLPFSKAIIGATRDLVCAYLFDFAAYFSIGAAGVIAMERAIAYVIGAGDDRPLVILHVPIASNAYVPAVSETALAVDAVTVSDAEFASVYDAALNGGVFIMNDMKAGKGRFDIQGRRLEYPFGGQIIEVSVLGDEAVYADQRDTFPDGVRAFVQNAVWGTDKKAPTS